MVEKAANFDIQAVHNSVLMILSFLSPKTWDLQLTHPASGMTLTVSKMSSMTTLDLEIS